MTNDIYYMRIIPTILIILILQVFPTLAQDGIAISTFSLSHGNNITQLIIEYGMSIEGTIVKKDTTKTKNVFQKFFGGTAITQEKKALSVSDIKKELIQIVSNNQNLKLEPEFPKDILQIIDLIHGKRKKEKARKIYISGSPEKMISISETNKTTTRDGYYTKMMTVAYTWHFRVNKKTSLIIPGFLLLHEEKTFQTKPMIIIL